MKWLEQLAEDTYPDDCDIDLLLDILQDRGYIVSLDSIDASYLAILQAFESDTAH